MLSGYGKHGIIISKVPVIQLGLREIVKEYLVDYDFSYCCSQETLTLLQLRRARLAIVDLSGEVGQRHEIYQSYGCLMAQYKDIHWVYLIDNSCSAQAKQLIEGTDNTLLFINESVTILGTALRLKLSGDDNVSQTLPVSKTGNIENLHRTARVLTLPERKVLRLLAKGWSINQIASLLVKSNKTISAQKNSALRRLSLRSNAEMYAWMNSIQGMKELNLNASAEERQEGINSE